MSSVSNNNSSTASAEIEPHQFIGVLYIVHGSVYLVLLIPCLLVIAQKEQLKHSCYKIMLVMTILDIINLWMASMLSGYYSYKGTQYCCGNEASMKIIGRFAHGLFFMYCAICVLLAFNRFVDIYSDKLASRLFGQRKTWYWLIVPFLYGVYFFMPWSTTIVYYSQYDIWIFTPDELGKSGIVIHTINNAATVFALFVLYALVCFVMRNRYKTQSDEVAALPISAMQIQVIVQSMVICLVTVVSCVTYVIAQYTETFPPALYKMTQIIWQFMHGSSGIIYLTFNRTIRLKVKRMILRKKNHVTTSTQPITITNRSRLQHHQNGNWLQNERT